MADITRNLILISPSLILSIALLACGGAGPSESLTNDRATSPSGTERGATTSEPGATLESSATSESTTEATSEAIPAADWTSAETDREALIALYNATGGPNWRYSWGRVTWVPASAGMTDGERRNGGDL